MPHSHPGMGGNESRIPCHILVVAVAFLVVISTVDPQSWEVRNTFTLTTDCSRMTGNTETIHVACSFRSDLVTTPPDYFLFADHTGITQSVRSLEWVRTNCY
jgi:hypothetical protein